MPKWLGPREDPLDSWSFLCLHSGLLLFSLVECLGKALSLAAAVHVRAQLHISKQIPRHFHNSPVTGSTDAVMLDYVLIVPLFGLF